MDPGGSGWEEWRGEGVSHEPSLTQALPRLHTCYLHSPRTPLVATESGGEGEKGRQEVKDSDLEGAWAGAGRWKVWVSAEPMGTALQAHLQSSSPCLTSPTVECRVEGDRESWKAD